MANPPIFQPGFNYSNWQATNPVKPLPAQQVDNDFANAARSINQAISAIGDVRRSDGKLKNGIVGPDALAPQFSLGFSFEGTWAEGVEYQVGDGVVFAQTFYASRASHTSSVANQPPDDDTWTLLFSLDDIVVAGALSMPAATFLSDGATTDFELGFFPISSRNVFVTIGGQIQDPSEYSINGSTLKFINGAPPTGPLGEAYSIVARGFATTATLVTPADGSVTPAKLASATTALFATAAQGAKADTALQPADITGTVGVTLESVPGFDPNNAHIAAAALAATYAGASSIHLHLKAKTYTFKSSVVFSVANFRLTAEPGNKAIITSDVPAETGAFEFGTQAALEPTGAVRQTITANLALAATSCLVTNAGAFSRGDTAGIVSGSGSASGEYWYGVTGQNGFERARKTEMVEIERVDYVANRVYFMAPLMDSYDCTANVVELRKFVPQGESFECHGVNWYGPGGGNTHSDVSTPSSGPRGFNVWGFKRVNYTGGSVRNFPRFFSMFYNCMYGGVISGVDVDGWDSLDASNFKSGDPAFRSVWFTGFFLCGGMNWAVSGNNYRNMRRLCDTDRGPWFPRNVVFANNTADNCEYVMSGHVAEKVEYIGNIGVRCRFGLMTRARHTKAIGNMIQCERYGMQAGPIAGSGITWDVNTARAGTLEFVDNTVEVSNGEYFASYMSFDRMLLAGNTCFGSVSTTLEGFDVQAKYQRDLTIINNLVDLSAGGGAATNNGIYVGDGGGVLEVQDGVTIRGNELRGGAQGIRFRGTSTGNGSTLGNRSRNIFIGDNKHVNHILRDIRFEQGAWDGARIRVNPGQSFGSRGLWPRVSLGTDMRRWSEMPLCDLMPTEKPNGEFIGFVNTPTDAAGANITYTTQRQGQKYWNVINPGTGQPTFYIIGQDGTRGTLQTAALGSVTGSISNGSPTLNCNDASNVFTGCYLSIAGAGVAAAALVARATAVVGNVVTLDTNASTTVSGAAVTFRNSSILSAATV